MVRRPKRYRTEPVRRPRPSHSRPGMLVCGCGRGFASQKDGMCSSCRGGSYLEAQRAADPLRDLGFDDCEVTNVF